MIIGLVATAASTAMQAKAQREQQKAAWDAANAQNNLMGAELARQNAFAQQSDEMVKQAIPQFDEASYADRLARAQAERQAIITAPLSTGGADYIGNPTAPRTLQSEGEQRLAEGRERGAQSAVSLANLGAYGLADLYGNIAMGDLANSLGRVGSFSKGSAGALRAEQNSAANAYAANAPYAGYNSAVMGDILGGAGNIASIYGMTKKPATTSDPWQIARGSPKTIYNPSATYYP